MNRPDWNHKQAIKLANVLRQIADRHKHAGARKVPQHRASKELKDLRAEVARLWERKESYLQVNPEHMEREAFSKAFQQAKQEWEAREKKLAALERKEAQVLIKEIRAEIEIEDHKVRERFRRHKAESNSNLPEPPALAA